MKTTKGPRKRMRPPRPMSSAERSAEAGAGGGTMTGEMVSLAEDIVGSYDARMERVAAIRDETAEQLGAFRREMRAMAGNLRRFLSDAVASIRAETGQLMDGFHREHAANAETWHHLAATMQRKRAEATR